MNFEKTYSEECVIANTEADIDWLLGILGNNTSRIIFHSPNTHPVVIPDKDVLAKMIFDEELRFHPLSELHYTRQCLEVWFGDENFEVSNITAWRIERLSDILMK